MKVQVSMAHVRIFRAVEGAVINTAHGHPRWKITDEMARSIAKRATGTLTAQWPDVLAARTQPSEANGSASMAVHWPPRRRYARTMKGRRPRRDLKPRRGQLFKLWKSISLQVGVAKRDGDEARAAALIDVLRLIHELSTCAISQSGRNA